MSRGGIVQVAVVAHELAPGHALGRHRPVLQQGPQLAALHTFDDVHGGKRQSILGRGDDSSLMTSMEGVCPCGSRVGSGRCGRSEGIERGRRSRAPEGQTGPGGAETAKQLSPRQTASERAAPVGAEPSLDLLGHPGTPARAHDVAAPTDRPTILFIS